MVMQHQLDEMRSGSKQTDDLVKAAQDSAKAAQDAVELASRRTKQQLRAYLDIKKGSIYRETDQLKFAFVVENTGDTPASEISTEIKFRIIKPNDTGVAIHNIVPNNNVWSPDLFLGKGVKIETDFFLDTSKGFEENISSVENGTAYLSIWVSVSYRDIFSDLHHVSLHYSNEREGPNKWELKLGDGGSQYD